MHHQGIVLGQSASFIAANAGARPKGLHWLQVLDQYFFITKSFCSDGQSDSYAGQQPFRHVGNDDSDSEKTTLLEGLFFEVVGDEEK